MQFRAAHTMHTVIPTRAKKTKKNIKKDYSPPLKSKSIQNQPNPEMVEGVSLLLYFFDQTLGLRVLFYNVIAHNKKINLV